MLQATTSTPVTPSRKIVAPRVLPPLLHTDPEAYSTGLKKKLQAPSSGPNRKLVKPIGRSMRRVCQVSAVSIE